LAEGDGARGVSVAECRQAPARRRQDAHRQQLLLGELVEVMEAHRSAFRQLRTWQRAWALVLASLFCFSRKTVSQHIVALGLWGWDWTCWYRFFGKRRVNYDVLCDCFIGETLKHVSKSEPYFVVIDGTHTVRSSKKMPGVSWSRVPGGLGNRPNLRPAQRFVNLSWLTPPENGYCRAVPLRWETACPPKAVESDEPARKEWEAGLKAVRYLRERLDQKGREKQLLVVLADGSYDANEVWSNVPHDTVLIVNGAKNRRLHTFPGATVAEEVEQARQQRQEREERRRSAKELAQGNQVVSDGQVVSDAEQEGDSAQEGGDRARRGRPPIYGKEAYHPQDYLHQRRGWTTEQYVVRGRDVSVNYRVEGPLLIERDAEHPVFLIVVKGKTSISRSGKKKSWPPRYHLINAVASDEERPAEPSAQPTMSSQPIMSSQPTTPSLAPQMPQMLQTAPADVAPAPPKRRVKGCAAVQRRLPAPPRSMYAGKAVDVAEKLSRSMRWRQSTGWRPARRAGSCRCPPLNFCSGHSSGGRWKFATENARRASA